jgi:cytochrome b561
MSDDRLASMDEWHYAKPAVILHWLLAILLVFMVSLGWYMMTIEHEPQGPRYFTLHMSVGMIVFVLVLARLLWRLGHKPAKLPADVPRWQVMASNIVEGLLYVCMVLLPVTGFLGASHTKRGVSFFGVNLPAWVAPNHGTAEQFFEIHETIVWILVALVVVHVAAALKHLLIDRDRVFRRMWF